MGECLRTQMHQRPYIDAADGRAAEIQGRRGGMLMNRPAPSAELVVTGIAAAVMCLYLTAPAVAQICTPDWEIISCASPIFRSSQTTTSRPVERFASDDVEALLTTETQNGRCWTRAGASLHGAVRRTTTAGVRKNPLTSCVATMARGGGSRPLLLKAPARS